MSSRHAQRVIIPILAGLGNSLMAMPMVRQIKRAWPDSHITILARSGAMGEPFKRLSEVDEVLITGVGIKALFRSIKWARPRKPDVYLIPFPSNRWHYSLLALTSGAKQKVLHSYPVGKITALGFIGQRMPAERGIHDVVQNLRLLKLLRIEPDERELPRFPVNDSDRAAASRYLESAGLPSGRSYIAVHAGSGSYTVIARAKRWPPRSYAQLIEQMKREFNMPVLLLEGPDEAGVAEGIFSHISNRDSLHVLKLAGPLGETAAVLERAALYVGSDSGLAHLAAAVGKRAVTIFAPADPERVCPAGSRDLVVQTPNSCSPCFTYPFQTPYTSSKCREPYCIEAVTVERVFESARRGLRSLV
ncbi:MAG TPA: glycosyltransferase family 9 protein [Tepidisphaeraceae bacterium]|nr:glycosyltransferase family 9 protein [Tepidisphaeraceae bacterium]